MPRTPSKPGPSKSVSRGGGRVLGTKAFAAITAVEGLRLSSLSRRRLEALKASGLSGDERRAEVLRAYVELGKRK